MQRRHGWTADLPLARRIRTPTAPATPEAEKIATLAPLLLTNHHFVSWPPKRCPCGW